MTRNRKHATSILLTEDQHKAIKAEAQDRNHSMSDIIREILDTHYRLGLPQRRGAIRRGRRQ